MAEVTNTTTAEPKTDVDYKALYEELNTKHTNLKASFDKASSDIANYKRQERDRMSEDEKKKAEAEEKDAYYKGLERELSISKYASELDDITDAKVRGDIVELFADGKITEALKKFKEWRKKDRTEIEKTIRADLLKQNPQPSAQGTVPTATRADILAIKDVEERQAAIAKNMHLFQ